MHFQSKYKMMVDKIRYLDGIRNKFQQYIDSTNIVYTFIAPKDKSSYERFFRLAANTSTYSSSLYEVLSDNNHILEILINNFPEDTDLEIYTATNDTMTPIFAKGSLKDYIIKKGIQFEY